MNVPRAIHDRFGLADVLALLGTFISLGSLGCATSPLIATEPVNGCDPATTTRYMATNEVEIRFGGQYGNEYVPKCITVSPGTRLRFRGDFLIHPLASGRFAAGQFEAEPKSPVQRTKAGEEASFVFSEPGAFGFVCYVHVINGMMGAVFVE